MSLAPKAFDVLRYLVEHADRLVTQDELLEALWPETYVNPEVIKKYVLGIRKALGDQFDKPVFIATFPRRGYQFIAPVREATTRSLSRRKVCLGVVDLIRHRRWRGTVGGSVFLPEKALWAVFSGIRWCSGPRFSSGSVPRRRVAILLELSSSRAS